MNFILMGYYCGRVRQLKYIWLKILMPIVIRNQHHNVKRTNYVDVNLGSDGNESIMGKIFDTPHDAYIRFIMNMIFYMCWAYKHKTTNEAYRKMYVCNKQWFKRSNANSLYRNAKKRRKHGKWFVDMFNDTRNHDLSITPTKVMKHLFYVKFHRSLSCKSLLVELDQLGLKSSQIKKKRRRELRIGYKQMLQISRGKHGKRFVDMFNDTRNHDLSITPTKVMKHRFYVKFHRSLSCKFLLVELDQLGLKSSQIKKLPIKIDATSKQCVDILSKEQRQYKSKEFYGLIKHFQDKPLVDHYLRTGLLEMFFWIDGRSSNAYTKFRDVFAVTYKMNKFKMSFSPFVGCVFNKYRYAIITDQDKAIDNTVKKMFPNTRHRYYAWHINKHDLETKNQHKNQFNP
uniref:MULE transposase domain-containing protein n=1 Tax=Lactuca sativa TaxID=4236 RepID=A0A9R1XDN6_LACSA|nr:hypothetical protein LSAT_V11C500273740 [Lactuca sativa]